LRLVAVEFNGYRRFATTQKLEVDGPITAIVGPNEAGKTSILNALMRLEDGDEIERLETSRKPVREHLGG
jgi:predicted ATP-dependent endonuclease of OLD family